VRSSITVSIERLFKYTRLRRPLTGSAGSLVWLSFLSEYPWVA